LIRAIVNGNLSYRIKYASTERDYQQFSDCQFLRDATVRPGEGFEASMQGYYNVKTDEVKLAKPTVWLQGIVAIRFVVPVFLD
jgi:hypothetical protein